MSDAKEEPVKKTEEAEKKPFVFTTKIVVLVVDDDPAFRKILKVMFKGANIEVVEAENGQEGLLKLTRHPDISIALIDIDMPQMDGIRLVKVIRDQEMYSRIPIIMVTAKSDQKSIIQSIKAGAQDYVVKPIDKASLIQKISKQLSDPEGASKK